MSKGWNTLPVLIIGEDTVLESGAALQLVLERFDKEGQLQVPVDAKERATYLYVSHGQCCRCNALADAGPA